MRTCTRMCIEDPYAHGLGVSNESSDVDESSSRDRHPRHHERRSGDRRY